MNRIGQQFGNYRLVTLLGQGGYAEVYLGQHVRLDLQAGIKVLHTHLTEQEATPFYQEAETIAKLTHPSIVRVFDFDVQEGVPFLVMDYAPGGSLRRHYPKGSLVPLAQIVSYVKQVAAALQYAHEHKFIHRDVKPENMLVGRHEEVLLSDFGLAALSHSSASLSTQEAIGTLPYMAPEQIEGHPRAASDQYALGVTVYEWLCGSRPFEGSATEVLVQHLTMPPPPLHEKVAPIPLGIEQVVLRALSKEPKARFASVRDFAEALEQASQHTPAHPMLLLPEVPAPDLAATTNYATIPVASSQPVLSTETTSSADLPARALEPTTFPSSTLPQDFAAPQSQDEEGMPLPGHMVTPTAAVISSPLEPIMPVRQRIRRFSGSRAVMLIGLTVLIIAGGILSTTSLLAHLSVKRTATPASAQTPQALYDRVTQSPPTIDSSLRTNDTIKWTESTSADGKYSCAFSGGAYHANAPYTPCLAQATNFGDLAYQVQMTIVKGEFGGLVFRVDSSQTKYYSFLIDSSGTYSLITSVDNTGTRDYVLHKGTSPFFKRGLNQANLIGVIARGSSISLYINQHYVTSASDNRYRAGQIGLFGGNYTQAPADVVFRHVQIWQL